MGKRKADAESRGFGIDIIGDIAWGTHFCLFYQTKEDLTDILVPYFAEGLRNNEFCMWITSEPLEVAKAKEALAQEVPNLEELIGSGHIEILPYTEWYLVGGKFDGDRVLEGWVQKEKDALTRGRDGLRLTGNTFWIERAGLKSFAAYEARVNDVIRSHKMIALCTYCLQKCTGNEIVDVIRNHAGALIRKGGNWNLVEDVTQRKGVEHALRESEQRFRTVFEQSALDARELREMRDYLENLLNYANAPIIVWDPEFRITKFNHAFEHITGLSSKEAVGKHLDILFPEDRKEQALNHIRNTLAGEHWETVEIPIAHRNGTVSTLLWNSANIYAESGPEIVATIAQGHDITERKKLQEKLEEYNRSLEATVAERTEQLGNAGRLAAIGSTAGMVGHDIRNPLQAIEGALYLAKQELRTLPPELDAKWNIDDMLATIEEQTRYINKIVLDLQDYARPLTPDLEQTDLQALVAGVLLAADFPQTVNVKVSVLIEDSFPKIMTDPSYLRRVLSNLISNSIAAMPNGGSLTVRAFRSGDTYITVEDTGTGIPDEIKPKIFTPLFTTRPKGQGFGLAVCQRMVEALNGTIGFESEVGKGTTFTIRLPNEAG